MNEKVKRGIFLYEYRSHHSTREAVRNIDAAFGEGTASQKTVSRWYAKFRDGDESLEDEPRSGRPSCLDNDALKALVESDPTQTVRQMADKLGVCHTTVEMHLRLIGKVKKLDQWVPHELNEQQKFNRFQVCSALLLRNENDPFLERIVTVDEKWVEYDNRQRSAQWLDADEPPKKTPKKPLHPKKIMLIVFWSATGIIHYDFLGQGQTINAEVYCQMLEVAKAKLLEIRPALVNRRGPILLQDNARPHVARPTLQKIHQLGFEALPHPPYSPDLSPTDYHLFKHMELYLRGKHFANQTLLIEDVCRFFTSREPGFYADGINALVSRWRRCVDADGTYFD